MMEESHILSASYLSVLQVSLLQEQPACYLAAGDGIPAGVKPELQMMYAGSKLGVVNTCGFTKVQQLI